MALGWNEIKDRAVSFSREWKDASNEEAEAKQFLIEFFNVFGISNRKVATFEHRVKKPGDQDGYIDLFWKGTLLVEMKSRGKNLDKAYKQAREYLHGLPEAEIPAFILVSDFQHIRLYDLEKKLLNDPETYLEFELPDLVKNVQHFGFLAGYQKHTYKPEDPVNTDAAFLMGKLHDDLKISGYSGHELEKYLVRLLFCLFADDTSIFEPHSFQDYLLNKTHEDGTDLGLHLAQIFQVLNTPPENRQKALDESLAAFPYVNGELFREQLSFASFNSRMRKTLLECCTLDWSRISPAIFGSMFQSVMNENERRSLGAHYTSEKNILKLIKPLFLDELWKEFEAVKHNSNKLKAFHQKIATLRFLDPACGCGNFLVITYRELRLLELEILKQQQKGQQVVDLESLILCNVDRFYGIEIEEFPAQIAQVALWLMDHQMNMMASLEFGEYFLRLPLRKTAHITHDNALRLDWNQLIEPLPWEKSNRFDYIMGNPPFVGKQMQSADQKKDMEQVFSGAKGAGVLDFVTAWYILAARYLKQNNTEEQKAKGTGTRAAFVSTNSISQGEQVGILWNELFNKYHIKIHFAHRTFKWGNEARGNAAVHVVILGFSNFDISEKRVFEYTDLRGEPHEFQVSNITPYLVEGKDLIIISRSTPICNNVTISYGSFALDDGNYTLSESEAQSLIIYDINTTKYIRPFIGGWEMLHSEKRYCLWLKDISPLELKSMSQVLEKVELVRSWREKSNRQNTKALAKTPTLFAEVRQPESNYLAFPTVSSENRQYIPIAFLEPRIIASNQLYIFPDASYFHFGLLTSAMHMNWVRYVCGRLESRYRYSASIVYNNFPWPENPTEKQKEAVEQAAQKVLDTREQFPGSSLADLYDPNTMPPALVKAHQELDKLVDLCYRPQPFPNETKRIEYLFELYDKYTAGLFKEQGAKRKGRRRKDEEV